MISPSFLPWFLFYVVRGEIQKKKAIQIFSVCLLACFHPSSTRWDDDDKSLDADILVMSSMAKAGGRTVWMDGWMTCYDMIRDDGNDPGNGILVCIL